MDVAASIQEVTERIMLAITRHAHRLTGSRNLCLAGGVALNCVSNGRILREGPFDRVWIQPAAGDAGGALGAALFTWYQLLEKPREARLPDLQRGTLLGPAFSDEEIADELRREGAVFTTAGSDGELAREVARHLAEGRVVGWFQGRMEFGPRALGGRSILGDPRSLGMQRTMNVKIKFRESFRPFAPSVLRDQVHRFFEMRENEDSAYMLLVSDVRPDKRLGDPDALAAARGLGKLMIPRSEIQAVTHVDHSARVQTVDAERNPLYHRLLEAFESLTGCPVLINTSFNVRGEPIVGSPKDAYFCFRATDMDVLAVGRHILVKEDQPRLEAGDLQRHLDQFALD
jgi:carbamoyltransferase